MMRIADSLMTDRDANRTVLSFVIGLSRSTVSISYVKPLRERERKIVKSTNFISPILDNYDGNFVDYKEKSGKNKQKITSV